MTSRLHLAPLARRGWNAIGLGWCEGVAEGYTGDGVGIEGEPAPQAASIRSAIRANHFTCQILLHRHPT